jgi:hypothetical protein
MILLKLSLDNKKISKKFKGEICHGIKESTKNYNIRGGKLIDFRPKSRPKRVFLSLENLIINIDQL